MRVIFFFLLATLSLSVNGQTNNPFLNLKFDKVMFYDFRENAEKGSFIVDHNGKFLQTILKQVQLDTITAKKLNGKLGDKKSYGSGTAACFDPHCGFVYFLKGKPVAQITICLGCNVLRSSLAFLHNTRVNKGKERTYTIFRMA